MKRLQMGQEITALLLEARLFTSCLKMVSMDNHKCNLDWPIMYKQVRRDAVIWFFTANQLAHSQMIYATHKRASFV
jgi:hypothetical protein